MTCVLGECKSRFKKHECGFLPTTPCAAKRVLDELSAWTPDKGQFALPSLDDIDIGNRLAEGIRDAGLAHVTTSRYGHYIYLRPITSDQNNEEKNDEG